MAKKIDYCPYCGVRLVADGKTTKMKCTTINCDFVDRRYGNSMVEPGRDRRQGGVSPHAPMVNPWAHVNMFR
jgi:hypothetical protein